MGAGEGWRLEGRMGIGIEEKEAKRDVTEGREKDWRERRKEVRERRMGKGLEKRKKRGM